jgi:hypothetical protein
MLKIIAHLGRFAMRKPDWQKDWAALTDKSNNGDRGVSS